MGRCLVLGAYIFVTRASSDAALVDSYLYRSYGDTGKSRIFGLNSGKVQATLSPASSHVTGLTIV